MVKQFLLIIAFLFSIQVMSQTGIGTTTPNASAKLDVFSDNKGFLPPRVSLSGVTDQSTIPSPAIGLLVYCKGDAGLAAGYYYWNGNAWATIATSGGSGSFAASFIRGSRTATQSIAVGGLVTFSNIDNSSGTDISLNTSTGKITLAPGNTYRIIAAVPNFSGGQRPAFMWYNETNSSYVGSASSSYNPGDAANLGAFGGIAHVIITPSVTTVLSFRLLSSLSSGTVTAGGNGDFSTTGSYPWFEAQVISGNAPVTGQSVDYIQASLSANQALTAVGNIIFNTSSGTGITITSGGFNLIANKTYKLEAAIGGASVGYAYYGWVDNSNNLLPGGSIGAVIKAGNVHTDAPQDKAVVYFTPSVDTRVFLRVYNLSGTLTAYAPSLSTNFSSTWASIQQVGSSAIVNPWTLSGNDTYNTIGNVGIGVTSPTDRLVVGSSIALHDGGDKLVGMGWSPGSGKAILTGYPAEIRLNPSTGKLSFGIDPTSRSIGSTAGVERRMTITSSGNIGIGTENPANKLHVQSSDASSVYIESTTSDNNGMVVLNANTGSNWNVNYHEFMIFQKQGTTIGFINAVANSNSVNYSSPSDYRLKTDFKNYGGLDLVNKIKTYDYAWKRDSSRMHGVMAHELQEVLPYLVSGTKDSVDVNGKIIPQAVDYSKLTPILVKAIQEQDVKIKELQLQIQALLKRLEIVESKK